MIIKTMANKKTQTDFISGTFFNVILLFSFAFLSFSTPSFASYESYNPKDWMTHDETSKEVIDHSVWNKFLKKYVKTDKNGLNRFNYGAVPPAERRALGHYIDELTKIRVSALNKKEQLAFWLNLYNASMVSIIMRHYPVKSVLKIGGKLTSRGPWNIKLYHIEGKPVSLGLIEEGIIHALWDDPRLFYSVSCASVGCGNVVKVAFTSKNTEELLEKNTINFVNSNRAIFGTHGPKIKISKIYKWHWKKFGGEKGILAHLKKYSQGDTRQALKRIKQIAGYDFNWALNDY